MAEETLAERRARLLGTPVETTSEETLAERRARLLSAEPVAKPVAKPAVVKPVVTKPVQPVAELPVPRVELPWLLAPETTTPQSVPFKPATNPRQDLYDAQDKKVAEAFSVDLINDTEEAKQKRAAEARRLAEQTIDYTPGGNPYTTFVNPGFYVEPTQYRDPDVTLPDGSVIPGKWNPLLTKPMAELVDISRQQAEGGYGNAFRPQVVDPGFNLRKGQYAQNIAALSNDLDHYSRVKDDPLLSEGTKDSILLAWEGQPTVQKAISDALDKIYSSTDPDEIERIKETVKLAAEADAPAGGILLAEDAKGRLIETNPMYALRMLNVPTAAVAGGIEGAYTSIGSGQPITQLPADIANAATRYVREGRGFSDLGSQALGRVGAWADEQVGNTDPEFEYIGSGLGGIGGLYADVMTGPVDAIAMTAKAPTMAAKGALRAAKGALRAVEGVPMDLLSDTARLGTKAVEAVEAIPGKVATKVSDTTKALATKTAETVRPMVGLSKNTDDAVVAAASNGRLTSLPARGEDPLTAVRNNTVKLLADDMVALHSRRLATDATVPKAIVGEPLHITQKREALRDLWDISSSRIKERGGIEAIANRFAQAGLVDLTPTAEQAKQLADGTLTRDSFLAGRLNTLADEVRPFNFLTPDELKAFSRNDIPVDDTYRKDLLQSLRSAIDNSQARALVNNLSKVSLPEVQLVVDGLDRITPAKFVSAKAVEPIMAELKTRMSGWSPVKVGDATVMRRGDETLSLQAHRELAIKTTDDIIRKQAIFSIKATDLADVANRLDIPQAAQPFSRSAPFTYVASRFSPLVDQINSQPIRNLFSPKEVRPGILGSVALSLGRLTGWGSEVGPRKEFLDTVSNAWGSIYDIFRKEVAIAKANGLDTKQAFAKVTMANPDDYFDRYLRVLYNLTDTLDEVYTGEKTVIGGTTTPWEWNQALKWLTAGPLATKKADFIKLYEAGQYNEAMDLLQQVTGALAGRKLGSLTDFAPGMQKQKLDISPQQIAKAGEAIPAFSADEFMKLTSVTYSRSKQSQLLKEAVTDFTAKYPDTFGTGGLDKQIEFYKYHALGTKFDLILSSAWRVEDEVENYIKIHGPTDVNGVGGRAVVRTFIEKKLKEASSIADAIEEVPGVFEALIKVETLNRIAIREAAALGVTPSLQAGLDGILSLYKATPADFNWRKFIEDNPQQVIDAINSTKPTKITGNNILVRRLLTGGDYLSNKNTLFDQFSNDMMRMYGPKSKVNLDALRQSILKTLTSEAGTEASIVDQINGIILRGSDDKMRKALAEASDVDSLGRVLGEILLPGGKRASGSELLEFAQALTVSFDKLRKTIPGSVSANASMHFADRWMWNLWGAYTRFNAWAKAGMLGGVWLPNFGYHVANAMTAPLIVLNTLGPEMAKASTFNMNGLKIMRGLTGQLPPETLVQFGKPGASRLFEMRELVDIIGKGSIQKSQAGAEMSKSMIDDMVMFSGRYSWGDAAKSWLRAPGHSRELADLANASDTFFRINVFAKAMDEGRTVEESLKLARESLYDYGSLSKFEREWLSKGLLFYTFWSRNMWQTGMNVLNDLTRPGNSRLAKAYRVQQATTSSEPNYDADYTTTKLGRFILGNSDYSLKSSGIPQEEALSELVGYLSTVAQAKTKLSKSTTEAAIDALSQGLDMGGAQWFARAPLIVQAAIGYFFQKEIAFGQTRNLSDTIDPRLFHYMEQDPRMFEYLAAAGVRLEKVDPDKLKPGGGTYEGTQYRIKKEDRANWFAIQTFATHLALKRMLGDYAEVTFGPGVNQGPDAPNSSTIRMRTKPQPDDLFDYRIQSTGPLEYGLRASGILSPTAKPTREQREEQILRGKVRQLSEE
jgi:hypothetical protein